VQKVRKPLLREPFPDSQSGDLDRHFRVDSFFIESFFELFVLELFLQIILETTRSFHKRISLIPGAISNDYTIFSVYLSKIGNVCVAGLLFGVEFLEDGGEAYPKFLDGGLLFGVFEGAVRLEGFVGFGDRHLVRQDQDADVAEDRADVDQPPQAP